MRKRSRFVVLLALGLVSWFAGALTANAQPFRRGIGVSAMAWAGIEPGPGQAFAFPPFSDQWHTLTRAELDTLRRTGFDFIRLAVDPGPFLQFEGARRDAVDRILMERIRMILASGLAVIVDFHPSDMHPDYTAQALTLGRDTPVFQSYLRLVERVASKLGRLDSPRVALELMNEPPIGPDAWQPMLEAAYAAARRGSKGLTLVVEGGNEASPAALMQIDLAGFAGDRAVLYAFHYYEPYQFTHQGAAWNPARHLIDVPYPALARPLQDSLEASAAAIAAAPLSPQQKAVAELDARMRLLDYRRSGFDGRAIGADFDRIAGWARAHGLSPTQILLGEFGARETELQRGGLRAAERAHWFHDIGEQAAKHGFGWAVWAYRGSGGFALAASDTGNEIDPNVARALGLTSPERAQAAPSAANTLAAMKR
jgi:hypothetical protein